MVMDDGNVMSFVQIVDVDVEIFHQRSKECDLLVGLNEKSQEPHSYSVSSLSTMNIWFTFQGNPFNSLFWTKDAV